MKNKIIYLILAAIIFYGCEKAPKQEIYPTINKIGVEDKSIRDIRLYVIDSCEYIGYVDMSSSDFLTHKGNCKFCAERNKK